MSNLKKRFPIYSRLMRLYPPAYQKQYGEQTLQTLSDMLDDPAHSKAAVWIRTGFDLPLSLAKQQISYTLLAMKRDNPDYIKKTALFSWLLLAPFFIFLMLDALTSHSLYGSWFWHPLVAATWLVFMPAAAFLISSSVFVYWLAHKKHNIWRSIFDLRHNWPLTIVAALSIGIIALAFLHDSVHCVVHNPIREIRYWHTTWRCIQQG